MVDISVKEKEPYYSLPATTCYRVYKLSISAGPPSMWSALFCMNQPLFRLRKLINLYYAVDVYKSNLQKIQRV